MKLRAVHALWLIASAPAVLAGACSQSPTSTADAGADVGTDSARAPRDSSVGEEIVPQPFDGWEAWPEYSAICKFYLAKAGTVPPLSWETCAQDMARFGNGCRQLRLDWDRPKALPSEWISSGPMAIPRKDGSILLMMSRGVEGDLVRMLVEPDGKVLHAIRENSLHCTLSATPSFGDHFAYRVYDSEATGQLNNKGGGAIGGRIDERPRVLFNFHDEKLHSFIAGNPGIMETQAGFAIHPWNDLGREITVSLPPEDAGLFPNAFVFVGDTLFWKMGDLAVLRQKIWTQSGGTRDFLTAGNDPTRGYGDLGTDGVDMVWSYGERSDPSKVYPVVSIVTSPYSEDPAKLTARTLRADIRGNGLGTDPWVVGCGYAARAVFFLPGATPAAGIDIVRLSDGRSWVLPDVFEDSFSWRKPLAVTCDELFALVRIKNHQADAAVTDAHWNIARIRLDALGPGTPP